MDRELARHRHGLHGEPARQLVLAAELQRSPRDLVVEALERAVEDVGLGEAATDAVGGVHRQRVVLAKREQAEAVIEVSVREDDGGDGGMPRLLRMERRKALDLLPDLRRGIEEHPVLAVAADGDAFLGSGNRLQGAGSDAPTVGAAAVPLGKPSTCSRAQNPDAHLSGRDTKDRKSTRLNSSHSQISYAGFCLE